MNSAQRRTIQRVAPPDHREHLRPVVSTRSAAAQTGAGSGSAPAASAARATNGSAMCRARLAMAGFDKLTPARAGNEYASAGIAGS